jgi:NCAIR mutase (PurE)-related protein
VLRAVADLLIAGVRDTDEVCRWAGDEYVILLPDTTAEQAERALERTRRKVATYDWSQFGLDVPVTISVGIASAARGDDRRTLFAAADGVLYDAKRSGRDRVVRLSGVTQTRAGDSPLDTLFGPAPVSAPEADTPPSAAPEEPDPDVSVDDVQPSPLDDRTSTSPSPAAGFAPLLAGPATGQPADPPLYLGGPGDPILGPAPTPALPERAPAAPAPTPATHAPEPVSGALSLPVSPAVEPEVLWATGRSTEQVLALVRTARREHPDRPALVLRATADTLVAVASEHDAYTTMDAAALAAAVGPMPDPAGRVTVLCANGGDPAVAAEAAFVARVTGSEVVRIDDVHGSRMRALLTEPTLAEAGCLVVVAGLDASVAGLLAASVDVPVVAVPTSAGQPGALGGLGALMAMLNASAGVAVSNVDNGYSAGLFASRVAKRSHRRPPADDARPIAVPRSS